MTWDPLAQGREEVSVDTDFEAGAGVEEEAEEVEEEAWIRLWKTSQVKYWEISLVWTDYDCNI